MKKNCAQWIPIAVIVLFLVLCPKASLDAASVWITGMDDDVRSIQVAARQKITDENQFYELKVMKGSKTVATASMTDTTVIYGLRKNNVYILYERKSTFHPDSGITTHTKWSRVKKFCTAFPRIGTNSKKKADGFWLKTPKIKGITRYKIYIGYSKKYKWRRNQKFKLYCTMKPGKKKKFKTYHGKPFTCSMGVYFIKVVPYNNKTKVPGYGTINKTYDLYYMIYSVKK